MRIVVVDRSAFRIAVSILRRSAAVSSASGRCPIVGTTHLLIQPASLSCTRGRMLDSRALSHMSHQALTVSFGFRAMLPLSPYSFSQSRIRLRTSALDAPVKVLRRRAPLGRNPASTAATQRPSL